MTDLAARRAVREWAAPLSKRERDLLALVRLRNNWTFKEMAVRQIGGLKGETLFRLMNGERDGRATTTYRIRAFLAKQLEADPDIKDFIARHTTIDPDDKPHRNGEG